ncbi:polyribonucleotide nucleotidyltransferase [Anaerobranca californiensis DSM 14826]|uniref:Polyribonucleotide nucleotidyltransferase n=1 Tax=Anaerobranca californiensis DSM 14826 TaxID=1120989 RepID=A0A1M6KDV5_9FIRM|nr:polyribonucleotide nucleotidyltransferase [Anaerobranca californiensis]SHJ57155.1 polyribonucleotide nucleotidyltransferase [Anaerobranca californiensis DSM 14826]
MEHKRFTYNFVGKDFTVDIGKFSKQAGGSAMIFYGETTILVNATAAKEAKEGVDFFPLTVDYEERLYAVGKIPGGFIKREGRPSEKAILAARLVDRPIRPLFPEGFRNAVHVVCTVMSVDQENLPEIAAINGASLALCISDIPFDGPVGAVLVGKVGDQLIINPSLEQREKSDLHLVVAGTKEAIMMVEAGANEVSEDVIIDALMLAHEEIKKIVQFQEEVVAEVGKEKMEVQLHKVDEELDRLVREMATEPLKQAIKTFDKQQREDNIAKVKLEVMEKLIEDYPEQTKDIAEILYNIVKEEVRRDIVENDSRPDGRKPDEIRPISCEVGILPRTHGSGLFTRGQTQVLSVCTLGPLGDVQILDGIGLEESKRYIHHYNFPPYSVGEPGFMRGPGRREIGHGALAERALEPLIPSEEEFPYTIRLVSEVLESNGSTSMGSVCASTLSLMDAGVPLKKPVSGVAMGLVHHEGKYKILTDIQGMEDFLGDMDFKVAGTRDGITALQMDIKLQGINKEILAQAIQKGKQGYLYILDKMMEVISEPRKQLSPYAPKIISYQINPDKIRDVIGPGGKIINKIIDQTGVKIDIEPDGKIFIATVDMEQGEKALKMIKDITAEVVVGENYFAKITRIEKFGAFAEVIPGKEGLIHISQLDIDRVAKAEDVVKVGDIVEVKCTEIDEKGRVNLSRKAVLKEREGEQK